jgi:CheY-like chemotaxis protein
MVMLNVLVVDDDEAFRAWVASALADRAVVVDVATPTEALWRLERTSIDVLLCDMRLATTTNGLEVLAAAREFWPKVGRILITGYAAEIGPDVPAHAILGKPCDADTLREVIWLVRALMEQPRSQALWEASRLGRLPLPS